MEPKAHNSLRVDKNFILRRRCICCQALVGVFFLVKFVPSIPANATFLNSDLSSPVIKLQHHCNGRRRYLQRCSLRQVTLRLRGAGAVHSIFAERRGVRLLVAVGGTNNGTYALNSVETLWQSSHRRRQRDTVRLWRKEDMSLSYGRDGLAVAACGSRIFAIGGYNGSVELSSVESIDFESEQPKWIIEPRLYKRRSNVGAAVLENKLYVIGGFNGTHDLPNVEVMQLESTGARLQGAAWHWGPQLSCRRSGSAVASLNGKLYAIGGFDGTQLLATAEALLPGSQRWAPLPPLPFGPRAGAAAAAVAGRIYVMGGTGCGGRSQTVESLDSREGRWRLEPALRSVRGGPAAVALEELQEVPHPFRFKLRGPVHRAARARGCGG